MELLFVHHTPYRVLALRTLGKCQKTDAAVSKSSTVGRTVSFSATGRDGEFGPQLALLKSMTDGISLCMIVKNEEDWIENAISSVISSVGEVIIVDTGSTDQTLERVRRFDPTVIRAEWTDHFGDARNISLEAAQFPWILVLDADECIASEDLGELERAAQGRHDGYHLTQRNYIYENHIHGWAPNTADYVEGKPYPGYVDNPLIRFFRNDERLRFHGAVHELIDPTRLPADLSFPNIPVVIHHYGKVRGQDRVVQKQHFYLKLGAKKLREDPTNAKAHMDYGIQLQELGRHEEAREPLVEAFKMGYSPVSLVHCAVAEKSLGNYDAARELLDRAAKAGLDTFELHLERGNVRLALGKFEKARESYFTCLERSVGSPVATFNIGLTYKKMGKIAKAVSYYKRASDLDSRFVEPVLELATLHTDSGEYEEAARLLEEIVADHPDRREPLLALVKAYLQLGRPDDALETVADRFGDDPVAESLRGAAYLEKGDHLQARAHLETAIRSDNSLVDARINISQIYGSAGEFARAARHLLHGYEKTGDPALLGNLSLYEARAGMLEAALPHLDAVIASGAAEPDHWVCRALILERLGLSKDLDEHYAAVVEHVPELREWVAGKQGLAAGPEPGSVTLEAVQQERS